MPILSKVKLKLRISSSTNQILGFRLTLYNRIRQQGLNQNYMNHLIVTTTNTFRQK